MRSRESADAGLSDSRRGLTLITWAVEHPLLLCVPVQAVLLFVDLGHLPVWGDEQSSLDRAVLGRVPPHTVHPGLYFLLLRAWLSTFDASASIAAARALSAVFLLVATLAIDRCWLRGLPPRQRAWFLTLWTLSPTLLLYGRMARSYSLQILLGSVALYAGSRYAERRTPTTLLAFAASSLAVLWTHYLPGVAIVAGVCVAMSWRALAEHRPATLLAALLPPLVLGLASAPWLARFDAALGQVAGHSTYHVLGRSADIVLALAFAAISFSCGESLWPWMLVMFLALSPLVALTALRGVRPAPPWLAFVAPAAVIGFLGAYRWVSYAFVAPRILFLLPFYLLLLVRGARGAIGTIICTGILLLSAGGIGAYFATSGFLNKAYVLPSQTIADAIRTGAEGERITVILDQYSSDVSAVAARLPTGARIVMVADAASAARAAALSGEPGLRQVWFVRSAHDVSPEQWNAVVTQAFAGQFSMRRTGFVPYSAFDRWLIRLAGWPRRPRYAIELVEWRAQGSPT